MKAIYKYSWEFMGGELSGVFVAEEEEMENLDGKELCFGDVLGKRSDIFFNWNNQEYPVKKMSSTIKDIEWFERLGLETGYNLTYLVFCKECGTNAYLSLSEEQWCTECLKDKKK